MSSQPTRTRRPKSRTQQAADAHDRIMQLRSARDAELATTPSAIAAKYEAREQAVRDSLDEDTLPYLDLLLNGVIP